MESVSVVSVLLALFFFDSIIYLGSTLILRKVNWINRLRERWKVGSALQVIIILVVFACTGFTVLYLKRPLFEFLFEGQEMPLWASVVYYILILPIYNVFLLFYGLIFGQFSFFWAFEKRFFNRVFSIFRKSNSK